MLKRTLQLFVFVWSCASVLTNVSEAATIGGQSGHGWPNGSLTCFQGGWSDMGNFCSVNTVLVLPLTVTHTGNSTVTVRAKGNGTTDFTTCKAIQNDQNNGGFFSSSLSTSSTTYQTLNLGVVSVASSNTLSVECNVAPVSGSLQGSVLNVNWS